MYVREETPRFRIQIRPSVVIRRNFLVPWQEMAFKRYKRATHFIRLLAHHVPVFNILQASRVKRVLPVQNLIGLPPCDFDLTGIRYDHIVAAIDYPAVTFPDSQA